MGGRPLSGTAFVAPPQPWRAPTSPPIDCRGFLWRAPQGGRRALLGGHRRATVPASAGLCLTLEWLLGLAAGPPRFPPDRPPASEGRVSWRPTHRACEGWRGGRGGDVLVDERCPEGGRGGRRASPLGQPGIPLRARHRQRRESGRGGLGVGGPHRRLALVLSLLLAPPLGRPCTPLSLAVVPVVAAARVLIDVGGGLAWPRPPPPRHRLHRALWWRQRRWVAAAAVAVVTVAAVAVV